MDEKILKYYIGLDIGTDSVGWAVTDENYNLIKKHGREFWGSYLFEEASTAEERRQKRTQRRRYQRTRQRILLLQELFAEEVEKVDPLFFIRLNNSKLIAEDKDGRLHSSNTLFDDANFNDKDFYKKYPTIYHLRAALIKGEVEDIRLVYLALHHIIKNRGHFLFENQNFDVNDSKIIFDKFSNINAFLADRNMPTLELNQLDEVLNTIKNRHYGKPVKQKKLCELFGVGKDKQLKEIIKAMVGAKSSLNYVCGVEDSDIKFSFETSNFEESLPEIESEVGEDIELILELKAIYDWSVLCDIIGDEKYISVAKVKAYDKHNADLKILKSYVREHCPEKQATIFRKQKDTKNYAAYVGMDKNHNVKKCTKDEFYQFIKKEIKLADKNLDSKAQYILNEIESDTFMPKLRSTMNSIIPIQLHAIELEKILENSQTRYPFLLKLDNDGLAISEKIKKILSFRIPYYVGPLNANSKFAWVQRAEGQEKTKVTPYNFDDVIDKDKSEVEFIRRMTNKCTYLKTEDVLPANSLLYSEYVFLNELNNLKINGQKSTEARKAIFEYAKQHKKVTLKNCLKVLENNGIVAKGTPISALTGTDGDFNSSLAVYKDLSFLGDRLITHSEMCEDIIFMITLLSDKDRLERNIRKKYSEILSDDEIKRLKGLNYTKWGRYSKKLLTEITSPKLTDNDGVQLSIIEAMRKTGENFMTLMAKKYGFSDAIDDYVRGNMPNDNISYETIDELYCSPSVKRAIWRTLDIVKEVVKVMKCQPKKVFIEMAREVNDESRKGKRTTSRKKQLIELYQNIQSEKRDWIQEIEKTPDSKFNSLKYYLYYCQMGRDLYTGEPLGLENIMNVKICDKDHIYPRSKIKDDSIDNLNLVYKSVNGRKKDEYPLSQEIRTKMTPFWTQLKTMGLMSEKKYERLVRNTPLSRDELTDFIQRQIVFTRQSTKEVAHILERILPESKIVYSKAGNVNEFKDELKILKIRDLNNLHHAKDAYANIVAGNIYYSKFGNNAEDFFNKNGLESYNLTKIYDEPIKGVWDISYKKQIRANAKKNTCQVIRMTATGKGELFNANITPAAQNADLIPVKGKGGQVDTSKYGGYKGVKNAYFVLVKSKDKKGKMSVSLEAYPLVHELSSKGAEDYKLKYLENNLGLVEPQILMDRIKFKTLICINGSYAYICGKTGVSISLANANELYLSEEGELILKEAIKYVEARKKYNNANLPVKEDMKVEDNLKLYDELVLKLKLPIYRGLSMQGQVGFLEASRDKFKELSRENQCVILCEMLHLFQSNKSNANLKLLGGGEFAGANTLSKNNLQEKDIQFIFQSPTGYYRTVVDLKDLL